MKGKTMNFPITEHCLGCGRKITGLSPRYFVFAKEKYVSSDMTIILFTYLEFSEHYKINVMCNDGWIYVGNVASSSCLAFAQFELVGAPLAAENHKKLLGSSIQPLEVYIKLMNSKINMASMIIEEIDLLKMIKQHHVQSQKYTQYPGMESWTVVPDPDEDKNE